MVWSIDQTDDWQDVPLHSRSALVKLNPAKKVNNCALHDVGLMSSCRHDVANNDLINETTKDIPVKVCNHQQTSAMCFAYGKAQVMMVRTGSSWMSAKYKIGSEGLTCILPGSRANLFEALLLVLSLSEPSHSPSLQLDPVMHRQNPQSCMRTTYAAQNVIGTVIASVCMQLWCLEHATCICFAESYSAWVLLSCVRTMLTALLSEPLQNCCCHQEWPTPLAFTRSYCNTCCCSSSIVLGFPTTTSLLHSK